jgi:hypothetical protein
MNKIRELKIGIFKRGSYIVEVFFYAEEWEVLEKEPIKPDNACIVQSIQEGDIS